MNFDQDNGYLAAPGLNLTAVNKDLWQAWANVFYNPTKPLSFGLNMFMVNVKHWVLHQMAVQKVKITE